VKSKDVIILSLLALLCLAAFMAANGGISADWAKSLISGVATSALAAAICLVVFWQVTPIDTQAVSELISRALKDKLDSDFAIVGRNFDMGHDFWVGLIASLDEIEDTVWFVGTRLSWWLRTETYRQPLKEKLIRRFRRAIGGRDGFALRILLADSAAVPEWKSFVESAIAEAVKGRANASQIRQALQKKTEVCEIPKELSKYSLVLCGDRLAVTSYISSGRAEDCPTFDVRPGSVVTELYRRDLERIMDAIQSRRVGDAERTNIHPQALA
jgi:hypothetical protein